MTCLTIIGNSHMGALRAAHARIAASFDAPEIRYFGLPGSHFSAAAVDQQGKFSIREGDTKARDLAQKINGCTSINLSGPDPLLIVGPRFRLSAVLRLCQTCDVAEWPRAARTALVSQSLFTAAIGAYVRESVAKLFAQFGARANVTVAAAAFPSVNVITKGAHHERPFALIARHPQADQIFEIFQTAITTALGDRGYAYLPQPAQTLAHPFLTRAAYTRGVQDFRNETQSADDERHMNADYGFSLFESYARRCLHMAPNEPGQTPQRKAKSDNVGS